MVSLQPGTVLRSNMGHRAKFGADQSYCRRDIANFRFFKMVAVRHLGFLNVRNVNCQSGSEGQYASVDWWCRISKWNYHSEAQSTVTKQKWQLLLRRSNGWICSNANNTTPIPRVSCVDTVSRRWFVGLQPAVWWHDAVSADKSAAVGMSGSVSTQIRCNCWISTNTCCNTVQITHIDVWRITQHRPEISHRTLQPLQ